MSNPPDLPQNCPSVSTFPRVHRTSRTERSEVEIGSCAVGGKHFTVIAGPCAIESQEQLHRSATLAHQAGAHILRGGAFKPRSSPYTFQGLGMEGVHLLHQVAREHGLPNVTEVLDATHIEAMEPYVDAFQVGARNMQNFILLSELGKTKKPVLLKRGFGATLTEWLLAAEHIASKGNENIILCERGIRSFGQELPFTLDLAGALWVQHQTHLPIIVDPSHATGTPHLISALAAATLAAGLDGIMIELHPTPSQARCDGEQALQPAQFVAMMDSLRVLAQSTIRGM